MRTSNLTARLTGMAYLGLAITGGLGFLFIRSQLYVPDDPLATFQNLVTQDGLARTGVALELATVLAQALAALLFYELFRRVSSFAAAGVAAFGMFNALAILASAAFLGSALDVAVQHGPAGAADASATVQLLYLLSENMWGVGNLFFGLWLVPMGWLTLRSANMPSLLGWVLIVGGAGYLISAFLPYLAPGATAASVPLAMPATVGELWMIAYLLIVAPEPRQAPTSRRSLPSARHDAVARAGAVTGTGTGAGGSIDVV